MIALTGKILLVLAFLGGIISLPAYFFSAKNEESGFLKVANVLFTIKGLLVAGASAILIFLILNHRFDFYYVYNYTSRDLELRYLISAFWGGQEGSFLLWITFGELVGLGLMKWIRPSYRPHVLFFLTLNQVLLLSMVLGIHLGDIQIGASPFRSIAEAFPNAPFLQTNPEFIPADGRGLNDLLKSPWMVIHPPILFFGFALLFTVFELLELAASLTVIPKETIFCASFSASLGSIDARIFAWPFSNSPAYKRSMIEGGRFKSLIELATELRAFPVTSAILSCVRENSLLSLSYPLASSIGFRSSR